MAERADVRTDWHRLPDIELPAPVMAVATGPDALWVGGLGGVGRLPDVPSTPGPLTSVAALCSAGGWLLAGGAEGLARHAGSDWQISEVQGTGAPVAALCALPDFDDSGKALAATLGDGVFRTGDRGRTWVPAYFGLAEDDVTALAVDPGGAVVAGTARGIYRSQNAGQAWRRSPGAEAVAVAALAVDPDGDMVAALESGGLLRSDDGGARWVSAGRTPGATALTVTPAGTLLLGTTDAGLLRSTDRGATWNPVWDALVLCLTVGDANTETNTGTSTDGSRSVYAGTATGLVASDDDGASWRAVPAPPTHDLSVLLAMSGGLLVAGPRTGLVRSAPASDGGWSVLDDVPLPLSGAAVAPDGALLVSGPTGLARLHDGKWASVLDGERGHVARLTFRADGTGWATFAMHGDAILRTADGGRTWTRQDAPFGAVPPTALQAFDDVVVAAVFDPRHGAAQLWATTDGATWRPEARAETAWPVVGSLGDPGVLSLGRTLCTRDSDAGWVVWTEFDEGVRAVTGSRSGVVALTAGGLWSVAADGRHGDALDAGLPVPEVLAVLLTQGRLYALLTGGRVWWRDIRPDDPTQGGAAT